MSDNTSTTAAARRLAIGRAGCGLTLLIHPGPVLKLALVPAEQRSVVAHRVVRILGARLLTQAVIETSRPTHTVLILGAAVDGIHALSAVGLAALGGPRWRRGALINTVTALAFGIATAKTAPRPRPPRPRPTDHARPTEEEPA